MGLRELFDEYGTIFLCVLGTVFAVTVLLIFIQAVRECMPQNQVADTGKRVDYFLPEDCPVICPTHGTKLYLKLGEEFDVWNYMTILDQSGNVLEQPVVQLSGEGVQDHRFIAKAAGVYRVFVTVYNQDKTARDILDFQLHVRETI